MKKIIMTIIAIMMVLTLVSCGKEESANLNYEVTVGDYLTETIIEENVIVENVIEENIETENHSMSDAEYKYLIDLYNKGKIELDVLMEMLTTGQCTKY